MVEETRQLRVVLVAGAKAIAILQSHDHDITGVASFTAGLLPLC